MENVPQMHAESGFETEETTHPLRVSGFICLILGLLSFVCTFGPALLVVPVITIVVGLFALRRYSGLKPVGTTAAKIGMVLAAGFGACGFFLPWFKTTTLGDEAKKFAKDYMSVVSRGEDLFAIELRKDYVNRLPADMDLREHYAISEAGSRRWEEFRDMQINETLRKMGPEAEWVLERPIRVYYSYGLEHAEIVWIDATGRTSTRVHMVLDYRIDSQGNGQWNVEICQPYTDVITAPAIL